MKLEKTIRIALCGAMVLAAASGGATERPLRGPFPLLVTPWTEDAKLDVPTLVKEAEFVNRCGAGGVIWPSAAEVLGNLSMDEYRRGLDALAARAARPDFKARLTAVCPGRSSAEALTRARLVNELQKKHNVEMALLARPPDNATNETAIVAHYRALGEVAECPVIIQTYNGKSPQQSVASIVALAKEFPQVYGWVKEESPGGLVNGRMAELVAAKPAIKTVFSGWGAKGWLYQGRRIGTEGVVTQRAPYADLLVYIWKRTPDVQHRRHVREGQRRHARSAPLRAAAARNLHQPPHAREGEGCQGRQGQEVGDEGRAALGSREGRDRRPPRGAETVSAQGRDRPARLKVEAKWHSMNSQL